MLKKNGVGNKQRRKKCKRNQEARKKETENTKNTI